MENTITLPSNPQNQLTEIHRILIGGIMLADRGDAEGAAKVMRHLDEELGKLRTTMGDMKDVMFKIANSIA